MIALSPIDAMFGWVSRKIRARCARPLGAAVLALPGFLISINITKANTMSVTWNMNLTVRTDKNAVHGMRDYLRERGIVIPMRDRDVVSKYMHRIIENGNARTAIEAPAAVTQPVTVATKKGFERSLWAPLDIPPHIRRSLYELAMCSFGLLMMLACYITFVR
jgi:hypothetical protein